jgi:hypothetical protein
MAAERSESFNNRSASPALDRCDVFIWNVRTAVRLREAARFDLAHRSGAEIQLGARAAPP